MSKKSNKAFNTIKEKRNTNYDERLERKKIKNLEKLKKQALKEE